MSMRASSPGKKNGPSKTPTSQRRKRGSRLVKHRDATEPQPEPGKPTKPRSLTGEAAVTWKRLVTVLDNAGMLTKADGETLERYCRLSAEWHAITDYAPEKLEVKTVEDLGIVQRHIDKMIKISDALLKIEMQFGMTPASRPNVKRLEKVHSAY